MSLNDNQFVKPINVNEIDQLKKEYLLRKAHEIPKEIIKIFNDLILEDFAGGSAKVSQPVVIERIVQVMKIPRNDIFSNGWLDVEPVFKEAGWKVSYNKPAYNESYDASWIFKKE
jgi:hypothetical protein